MKKFLHILLVQPLLAIMALLAVPGLAKAQGKYTVNIDDVSRVSVFYETTDFEIVPAADFGNGDNIRDITDDYQRIIFRPANEQSAITKVRVAFGYGDETDLSYSNYYEGYSQSINGGSDGTVFTVTSEAVTVTEATATVKIDNISNLYFFNSGSANMKPNMSNGTNMITFNPATGNPFAFMIAGTVAKENISVALNGESVAPTSGTSYSVTLADGDVLVIRTQPAKTEAETTITIDNVANLNYFKHGDDVITATLVNGANKVTFNPATDNTFSLMTKAGLNQDDVLVTLNGTAIEPSMGGSYGVMYNNITLDDGDVLVVKTEPAPVVGGDDDELPSNKGITEIITALPEDGMKKHQALYGKSVTFNMESGINQLPADGFVGDVAFYDNGDVYLKTPISLDDDMDAYLKGTYADGIITIPLPQKIYSEYF